jgi:hypothetical protein
MIESKAKSSPLRLPGNLLDHLDVGICKLDRQLNIVDWDKRLEAKGLARDDFVGKSLGGAFAPYLKTRAQRDSLLGTAESMFAQGPSAPNEGQH